MKKNFSILLLFCAALSLCAQTVLDIDFANISKREMSYWGIPESALVPGGVKTVKAKKPFSRKNPMEDLLPIGDDGSCVKVEIEFTPLAFGHYSTDFRWGGALVSIVDKKGTVKLNARYHGKEKIKLNARCTQEFIIFRNRTISWKLNGKEQLPYPQGTWKPNGALERVQIAEWENDSQTVWHKIKITKLKLEQARKEAIHSLIENPEWNRIADGDVNDFAATVLSGMDKVFQEVNDFSYPLNNRTVRLSSAGRETENFQIALIPLRKDLKNINFEISDLRTKDNRVFSAENIFWNPVGYVLTRSGEGVFNRPVRRWPDILLPQKPFDILQGKAGSAMFSVKVPPGFKGGLFRGWIKITADDVKPQFIAIELKVRNFTIPLRGKFQTLFNLDPGCWEAWYNPVAARKIYNIPQTDPARYNSKYTKQYPGTLSAISEKDWFKFYDIMLDHRLNPVGIYNQTDCDMAPRLFPPLKHLEYCYKKGMNHMCVGALESFYKVPEEKNQLFLDKLGETLNQVTEFRKANNWKDFQWSLHIEDETEIKYTTPETRKKSDAKLRLSNAFVKKNWPFILRETANPYIPRLRKTFNMWVPRTNEYDKITPEQWKQIRKDGDLVWVYVCTGPNHPYANFFVDQPGTAPRVLFWQLYKRNISGLLYYLVSNVAGQKNFDLPLPKWPDNGIEWEIFNARRNGDGNLIYPGKNCTPLSSIRLENIRDGIEDFEVLELLARRYRAAKAQKKNIPADLDKKCKYLLDVPQHITSNWTTWTQDPQQLKNVRAEVDEAIEKIDRLR